LKVHDFEMIAKAICGVFSSELPSTYYSAKVHGNRPKGKLYNSYQRWKHILRESGLSKQPQNEQPVNNIKLEPILNENDDGGE
jgi:hypothetical protein